MSAEERRKTTSTEKRFVALLDADEDQLPHRLRQMVALLGEQPIDFDALMNDLLHWNRDENRPQIAWARNFYRTINPTSETEIEMETTE